jgi:hypothetical protein
MPRQAPCNCQSHRSAFGPGRRRVSAMAIPSAVIRSLIVSRIEVGRCLPRSARWHKARETRAEHLPAGSALIPALLSDRH